MKFNGRIRPQFILINHQFVLNCQIAVMHDLFVEHNEMTSNSNIADGDSKPFRMINLLKCETNVKQM
jgi:hypothetical protein